ncbi:NADAR family protein [Pseudodesulfovibrio pelocollis]|uniref:NADAR family protein n=1 Tax=Pseudodesulfovibrio pelocollis TaxID=3051432 RepID=UPI00255B0056|nr:NADAR family protein [Pseudodesulfovibrio sp. SB368]
MDQNVNPFLFFRKEDVFSHWAPIGFHVCGLNYCCGEQYLMHQKAMLFGDIGIAGQIMHTADPKEHKKLGRMVARFDIEEWEAKARYIAYLGNFAKAAQNINVLLELLKTGERPIAEASPYDAVWGIGLAKDDPRAQNPESWQGSNWLGQVWMQVRRTFQQTGVDRWMI